MTGMFKVTAKTATPPVRIASPCSRGRFAVTVKPSIATTSAATRAVLDSEATMTAYSAAMSPILTNIGIQTAKIMHIVMTQYIA